MAEKKKKQGWGMNMCMYETRQSQKVEAFMPSGQEEKSEFKKKKEIMRKVDKRKAN